MCSCGGGKAKWVVTYPDGHTETKSSAVAARIAASKVSGATWSRAT
jgi:hypothetical protein